MGAELPTAVWKMVNAVRYGISLTGEGRETTKEFLQFIKDRRDDKTHRCLYHLKDVTNHSS